MQIEIKRLLKHRRKVQEYAERRAERKLAENYPMLFLCETDQHIQKLLEIEEAYKKSQVQLVEELVEQKRITEQLVDEIKFLKSWRYM
jgi:hypothetical protein